MITIPADYRIHLTYDEAVAIAEDLAREFPSRKATQAYYDGEGKPLCIVAHILDRAGFKAPQEWWGDYRSNLRGEQITSGSYRYATHIRFLTSELFSNEDLARNSFLITLQSRQDGKTKVWEKVVRHSKAYVTRLITARNK